MIAAAVCPNPPALVPDLALAAELADVRSAAVEAVRTLCAADPELLIVVGGGAERTSYAAGSTGSFAEYGVDVSVSLPWVPPMADPATRAGAPVMPLPLLVGAWLLGQAGWQGATRGEVIAEDASAADCADVGAALVADVDRVGLLVMGDGAAGRTEQAPRPYDPRAETFDGEVAAALRAADPAALLRLDSALAAELTVAGRAAWQVLAGATGEPFMDADLLYDGAPLGVGYIVAVWERHG
jgi:hypothetical protein